MTETKDPITVLAIDLDPIATEIATQIFGASRLLERAYDLEKLLEENFDPPPILILCGRPPEGLSLNEVAQALRMQHQSIAILYLTTVREGHDRKIFQKNGFTDAFLLPVERDFLTNFLRETFSHATQGKIKSYRSVKLIDIAPGVALDFDTYLYMPANKKHIRYSAAGDPLDIERVEKLAKHQMSSIHITSDQIKSFYQYTAKQLKNLGTNGAISETERRERMQGAIRDLMSGMFSESTQDSTIEKGRSIMGDCQEIVKSYITTGGASGEKKNTWYEKLMNAQNAGASTHSHAANVATFSALFSLGLGIGDPESMAIAGLLHDIGLVDVRATIQTRPRSQWLPDEKAEYERHPELTINLIKARKMIVPELVTKMIAQHHERFDGSGYPRQLQSSRILPEAQVLSLADEFDDLCNPTDGRTPLKPLEAVQELSRGNLFDPELTRKLSGLLKG